MQTKDSKDLIFYEGPDYSVRLEYNKELLIVHLPYVKEMNKRVFIDMSKRLISGFEFFNMVGYKYLWAAVKPEDEATNKLAFAMNFRFIGESDGYNIFRYGD